MRRAGLCGWLLTGVLSAQFFGPSPPPYLNLHRASDRLDLGARALLLLDQGSGSVLHRYNERQPLSSASLAKLATLLWVQVKAEREGLDAASVIGVRPSGDARLRPPGAVLFGLQSGQEWPLRNLLLATASLSAADTSYALADYFGPGVEGFRLQLNAMAGLLRLNASIFADVDGWSDATRMSALDLARLTDLYVRHFPAALRDYHSPLRVTVASGAVKRNTNLLLERYPGVDGVKTGFTYEAGFNMVASAVRGDQRLVAVVMGLEAATPAEGMEARAQASARLLDYGFSQFTTLFLDRLPQLWVQEGGADYCWDAILEKPVRLTRYYPTLEQQQYHLRLDRVLASQQQVSAFLFLQDEEGRAVQTLRLRLRLQTKGRLARLAMENRALAALEHEGFISGLLRMVAIKLPLSSQESSGGKG